MNESEATAALRQMGVRPTAELIRNWLRAEEGEEISDSRDAAELPFANAMCGRRAANDGPVDDSSAAAAEPRPRADGLPCGTSKSNLEPILREQHALEKKIRVGRPGRPRIIGSWMLDVAQTTANGTSLPMALRMHGIHLDEKQLRALYRNVAFKEMRHEARRNYLYEIWSRRRQSCNRAAPELPENPRDPR